ncbi:hypothetical protein OG292_10780 [Streptomyces sp. NBC_01511]|uniref:hypothetical protein n=1 Tax=Streptomyces sp. NBC_01511 TaxID=2903889 RepID=UPI0038645B7B
MSPWEYVNDSTRARRWLAEKGLTEADGGGWIEAGTDDRAPGAALTANDVAHAWTRAALRDHGLDAAGRLRLGFGLLDLLDEYWVLAEIGFALADEDDPLPADAFWTGCRRRLESAEEPKALTYALWVDWFEDRATAETAFARVLGDDVDALPRAERPLLLRAEWVLRASGPVPWPVKRRVYEAAAAVPALHGALFRALLGGYHAVYGELDPGAALVLLRRLDLPPGTESLAELGAVLEAGHKNHYAAPDAWPDRSSPSGG